MKNIFIAICALILGICATGFIPVVHYIESIGGSWLLEEYVLLPLLFLFILWTVKRLYHDAGYTDEFLPFQLGLLSIALAIIGLLVFSRIMILGLIILIIAANWNRGIIQNLMRT